MPNYAKLRSCTKKLFPEVRISMPNYVNVQYLPFNFSVCNKVSHSTLFYAEFLLTREHYASPPTKDHGGDT